MYLQGKAEYWWRGTGYNPYTLPWHQFCRLLEDRFLEISTAEIIGQFHNLKQTATVPGYIDKFEEYTGLVKRNNPSLPEDYFISSFIARLKDYIQHHLQCHKPISLTQLSGLLEGWNKLLHNKRDTIYFHKYQGQSSSGTRNKSPLSQKTLLTLL